MLEKICKKCLVSRINIDFKKEKRRRGSWHKKNYHLLIRKTPEKTYHKEGKRCLSSLPHILLHCSSLWTFKQWFLPTTPASQPLSSWTAKSDGPQPIFTGGRNERISPHLAPHLGFLLPRLTSHVWQRSTESNISFPLSSFGTNSFPGWNRSNHCRAVTKLFLHI